MGRFLFWTIIFLVVGGFILHFDSNVPFISLWLGKLPGDFVFKNKKMVIYFPVASAAIVSLVFSFVIWLFTRKKES